MLGGVWGEVVGVDDNEDPGIDGTPVAGRGTVVGAGIVVVVADDIVVVVGERTGVVVAISGEPGDVRVEDDSSWGEVEADQIAAVKTRTTSVPSDAQELY